MDDKFWLKQYTPGVPDTINPDAFSSLSALFEKYAKQYAQCPAFTNFGVAMTYQKMREYVDQFATYLQQHCGLKKGDRFAIMMPNVLQYPVAIFSALKVGLVVVNVNPLYTATELEKQLNDAAVDGILVLENFADRLADALPNTNIKHVIVAKLGDLLGAVKGTIINCVARYLKGAVPDYDIPNITFFKQAMKISHRYQLEPVSMKNTDIAFLQYTGGTTGGSKGAILTHRNLIANVQQCVSWIKGVKTNREPVMLGALPMYHVFSLTVCGMCIMPMGASTVLITNPRDIKRFIREIKKCGMTMVIGLNTLMNALLNHPDFKKVDFSRLRITISGGMAMTHDVAERWHKVTGVPVLEGYGLTEASPVLTLCPINATHFTGSVGVPISSTEVVIRDESGNDLPLNKQGELWARGPQVMRGYWKKDEETKNVIDAKGWLRTGDIAYMDERGFVYIVDRKKDMIVVSGFNVYPNEIEDVLTSHPDVVLAAVIGVPSEKTGEALRAYIVPGRPDLTEKELIAFCRQSLTGYKIPKQFEFRDELPLSNVGKVLRRTLRDEALKKVEESVTV